MSHYAKIYIGMEPREGKRVGCDDMDVAEDVELDLCQSICPILYSASVGVALSVGFLLDCEEFEVMESLCE
jgi:hypothetical protein